MSIHELIQLDKSNTVNCLLLQTIQRVFFDLPISSIEENYCRSKRRDKSQADVCDVLKSRSKQSVQSATLYNQ